MERIIFTWLSCNLDRECELRFTDSTCHQHEHEWREIWWPWLLNHKNSPYFWGRLIVAHFFWGVLLSFVLELRPLWIVASQLKISSPGRWFIPLLKTGSGAVIILSAQIIGTRIFPRIVGLDFSDRIIFTGLSCILDCQQGCELQFVDFTWIRGRWFLNQKKSPYSWGRLIVAHFYFWGAFVVFNLNWRPDCSRITPCLNCGITVANWVQYCVD